MKKLLTMVFAALSIAAYGQSDFNGLNTNMSNLFMLSNAKTRSISPENFTGEKGKGGMSKLGEGAASHEARELGQGWKVSPYIIIEPGSTFTLAEIDGSGAIQHIWMTPTGNWRFYVIRFYWDDEKEPSVEVPVGDFFGMGWGEYSHLNSAAVCVNPGRAFNCYWQMPFRKKCKITMENIDVKATRLYYQIDYALTDVPKDAAYFHAQFRRPRPDREKDAYTIIDGVKGQGQYVGTYLAWQVNNNGWWGEGEIKFFMDGDKEFPTICGTGTEDYFCGSYNFDVKGQYTEFSTPYAGLHQVIRPDGTYQANTRFGLYRWHIVDPVRFDKDMKVTIQDLGWKSEGRYLQQASDIASVAFWYQTEPHAAFPKLPTKDELEFK
ncbi:MAG: glycoside hydrolase family 172 protein [Cyclobacteriaceae bacterium]|nr:glycoside hydrolase family 172 protein [Cyclobacteriaceae bacterium]